MAKSVSLPTHPPPKRAAGGDVITKAGLVKVTDGVDLERAARASRSVKKIELMVRRNSETSSKQSSLAALLARAANAVRAQLNSGRTPRERARSVVAEKPVVGSAAKDRAWEILGVTSRKLPTGDASSDGAAVPWRDAGGRCPAAEPPLR